MRFFLYFLQAFLMLSPLLLLLAIGFAAFFALDASMPDEAGDIDERQSTASIDPIPNKEFDGYRQVWLSWGDSYCENLSTGEFCWINRAVEYNPEEQTLTHIRELRAKGNLATVGELSEFDTATLLRRMYYHSAAVLFRDSHLGEYDLTVEEQLSYKREVLSWSYHTSECDEMAAQRDDHIREAAVRIGHGEFMWWLNSIY